MADPRERAASLAQKLLRTAGSKGASDNERQIAAIHAAELIVEHELSVVADEREVDRKARGRAERQAQRTGGFAETINNFVRETINEAARRATHSYDWKQITTSAPQQCQQCGGLIRQGELCWFAERRGHIHHDITCSTNSRRDT